MGRWMLDFRYKDHLPSDPKITRTAHWMWPLPAMADMDMFDDSLCTYLHSYCIFLMNILILVLRWNASYVRVSTSNKLTYFKVMVGSNISASMSQEISQCCRVTWNTAKSRYLENDRAWLAAGDGKGGGYITVHIDKGTAHLQITNLECDKFGCIELWYNYI